ncbi:MAG: rhomboid family intramembrane serine protease [Pseudomonas marincola]
MNLLFTKLKPVLFLLAVVWAVEIVNLLMGHSLSSFGILPRTISGLVGIPLAPFLHAGLWHAISNTLPFLILGGLLLTNGQDKFWVTTIFIILLSGLLVWLFARGSYHVGASALIFGYFGALLGRAFFERSFSSLIVAAITVVLYGGLLWGILPVRSYISFEGHFFGLVSGVFCSWVLYKRNQELVG